MPTKLPAALLAASAALVAGAVAAFLAGGPVLIAAGVGAALLALMLGLAGAGLLRDPAARAAVAHRLAEARGEQATAAPEPAVDAAEQGIAAAPITADLKQGFTVPANRQQRRAQARAGRRG